MSLLNTKHDERSLSPCEITCSVTNLVTQVRSYRLPPTALVPNSPHPLLHYPNLLSTAFDRSVAPLYFRLLANGWRVQWIIRYGATQRAHYHSGAHECMAVLSGRATIRFGVADTANPADLKLGLAEIVDLEASTHGSAREAGGIELQAAVGDVFVVPAGMAHKTFDAAPAAEFAVLTAGEGHGLEADDMRAALAAVELSGFTMIGAYPVGGEWDFAMGGEDEGRYEGVWAVPKPECDPVLGEDAAGLVGLW